MPRTIPLATLQGITIRAHPSAFVGFLALLLVLATAYFPGTIPNERSQTYWAAAFLTTFFLFASVIAHELGHSFVARARKVPVSAVSLMMFSGSSDVDRDSQQPLDEAAISVMGPTISLVLAALTAIARVAIPGQSLALMGSLELVLILNLWLGVFNLLPTLPLDGGHAIRGFFWYRTGDFRRGTRIASLVGRALAGLLFLAGLALLLLSLDNAQSFPNPFSYDPRVVALILILLAWFLNAGSRNAYRHAVMEQWFHGVPVSRIMTTDPATVPPWTSLDEVVNDFFLQRGERCVAVVRDGDVLAGLLAYSDTRKVPRGEWATHAAGEVMTPLNDLIKVGPGDSIDVAIKHMAERHLNQLPVVEGGKLVGMIARVNVLRFRDLKDEAA